MMLRKAHLINMATDMDTVMGMDTVMATRKR